MFLDHFPILHKNKLIKNKTIYDDFMSHNKIGYYERSMIVKLSQLIVSQMELTDFYHLKRSAKR